MNRNNENYTFLFVTLGLLTAFGPFVTDFYLPALPALADYFRSSASMAQMSLTTGMFGLAVGQVFIGPISDRYGRRMPLLVSMAAFIVATALCIVAPNIYLFNLLRLFQGFTAAGGIVLARSIATDMYTGNELTRFIAMISAVNGVAPVVAPVVGGMLLDFTSWKGTFVLLLLVGAALAVLCSQVRESLPVARRSARGVLSAFAPTARCSEIRNMSLFWRLMPRLCWCCSPISPLRRSFCNRGTDFRHWRSDFVLQPTPSVSVSVVPWRAGLPTRIADCASAAARPSLWPSSRRPLCG